ncbi:uncharacterized protein LOC103715302 [Phoenix dactylifera]|uniref:Uncharacterized protein LOC103715302 n=1 Tax=Phoenix dactylifera TaxID=42345 RepID=A0A8B9A042_PHODC|nr:uncharacterized protein LOC103715302 [Phoenix dactylifera]
MGLSTNRSVVARRSVRIIPMCEECPDMEESVSHVQFSCPRAVQVWRRASFPMPHSVKSAEELLRQLREAMRRLSSAEWGITYAYMPYHIWLDRNVCLFEGKRTSTRAVVDRALLQVVEIINTTMTISSEMARDIWDSHFVVAVPKFTFVYWKPPPPGPSQGFGNPLKYGSQMEEETPLGRVWRLKEVKVPDTSSARRDGDAIDP